MIDTSPIQELIKLTLQNNYSPMVWKVDPILTHQSIHTSRLKIVKVPKLYNPIEYDHLLRKTT
jgi:hypothetical protein